MFKNEPLTDFTVADNRERFANALDRLESRLKIAPLKAGSIINGEHILSGEKCEREDPSTPSVIVGNTYFADAASVQKALAVVQAGQPAWKMTPAEKRAGILKQTAHIMRERKFDLAALIVLEAGKTWKEADADVAEAIDFCDYYAAEMLKLAQPLKTEEVPGEDNHYFYQPRGIAVVIAPWNFPLAIACGMTAAALVAGNAAILKPAEQTGLIAFEFALILLQAGIPPDAFAFLPGRGEVIGEMLVEHSLVDLICFTGSKAVGLEIIRKAAEATPQQRGVKRVIVELGGKNAVIVDEDADLDEAVKGVIHSAFGYAGQKCSACSRLIAVGSAYDAFLARFKEAVSDIIVGEAKNPATLLGPVIDKDAKQRILSIIESAKNSNKLVFMGKVPATGHFVPATVFVDVKSDSQIWREEIFGPVLACTRAQTFDEALKLANDSQYALTGGVFSRSPTNIEKARRGFEVGNLYINRGCTGALVCRQPFGGFKMSGIGSKAGGPDYLLQFMEPRTITENTLRRGFAPSKG